MSRLAEIRRNLGHMVHMADDSRQLYFNTSAKIVEQGAARLDDLSRLSRLLGPRLRHFLDRRIDDLQARLDALNCSLAKRAVPPDRRERVQQLALRPPFRDRQDLCIVSSAHDKQSGSQATPGPQAEQTKSSSPEAARKIPDAPKLTDSNAALPKRKRVQRSSEIKTAKPVRATGSKPKKTGAGKRARNKPVRKE